MNKLLNKSPLEQEPKLSNSVPIPMEVFNYKLKEPNVPGLYHYHKFLELLYCAEGQIEVRTFSGNVILNQNDMMLINSNEPHGTTSLTQNSSHYCAKFFKDLLSPFYDKDMIHYAKIAAILSNLNHYVYIPAEYVSKYKYSIKELFNEAAMCYSKDKASDKLTMYSDILNIVSFVFEHLNHDISETINAEQIKNKQDIVLKINAYMKINYQEATLAKLARECSVNYSYLSSIFKDLYGESFKTYIIKLRIDKSITLLCESDMDISTIAQHVGFATSSHYIKMFKHIKNVSPGKFRKLTQAKVNKN